MIPVFNTDYAWAVDDPVRSQEVDEKNQSDELTDENSSNTKGELEGGSKDSDTADVEGSDNKVNDSDPSITEELETQEETQSLSITEEQEELQSIKTYSVNYKAHVAIEGWHGWKKDGALSGTTGKSRAIEALQLKLEGKGYSGSIEYKTHVQNIGWQNYVKDGATSGTTGRSLRSEAVSILLTGEISNYYDVFYRVHSAEIGWLGWASNGEEAGTSGFGYRMEALEVKLVKKNTGIVDTKPAFKKKPMSISLNAHVQNIGWQGERDDGKMVGTTGRSLRLEAISLYISNPDYAGSIVYRSHVQNIGWQGWKRDSQISGTTGRGLRLESTQIKLTGEIAQHYDIYYRVHASDIGWMGWAKNGEVAGIPNSSSRGEALEVKLVKRGEKVPGSTVNHTASLGLGAQANVQKSGWQSQGVGNQLFGTTGKSLRLEAFKLWVDNSSLSGGIEYRAHVSDIGWQGWKKNGAIAGTEGESRRVEAIQIRLTGDISKYFDVYYRAHVANWGWQGWAKNGAKAGTSKLSIAMEAVEIVVVAKGAAAPGSTSGSYWETPPIPATYRAMNSRVAGLSSPTGWLIAIDSRNCLVGVYSGSQGNWRNVYMWPCSPGAASTPTVKGIYSVGMRGYVFGSGYSCYWWTQFYGDYLFHSVLYYPGTNRIMEGVMGVPVSQGCVRLDIGNAKWIYGNIPSRTTVLSY